MRERFINREPLSDLNLKKVVDEVNSLLRDFLPGISWIHKRCISDLVSDVFLFIEWECTRETESLVDVIVIFINTTVT